MRQFVKKLRTAVIIAAMTCPGITKGQGRYVTGDFHQHTTYTDGSYTIGHMMEKSNQFGLDWWANSEHGGAGNRWGAASGIDLGSLVSWDNTGIVLQGKANGNNMWRWQSLTEWSFRDVQLYRRVFPTKIIIQGLEWNPPGHEHASVGIIGNQFNSINPDVNAIATFEYLFDAVDADDSQPLGITTTKNMVNNHKKAIEAVTWLQANYPTQSWVVPAHPERFRYESDQLNYHGWNIEHFRDLNNAAPDVFFGFESLPGHQSASNRGEYHSGRGTHGSYGICTYGGAGWMSAKVGGLWDALLSEGRKFWLFASSDAHICGDSVTAQPDFYPGEYQKTYTYVTEFTPQGIVDGMRSGNNYSVYGDLIDTLQFTIGNTMMGEMHTTSDSIVTITVRLRVPATNYNIFGGSNVPTLDHFDIIAGKVIGKITPPAVVPADGKTGYSDAYKCDTVSTTRVIARFGKTTTAADPCGMATTVWTEQDGFITASYNCTIPQGEKMYFRLRGTNQPLNTLNETDACGNPLPDTLMGTNTAAKAFADLWFYSNPVFATNNSTTNIEEANNINDIQVYPSPTNDYIYIKGGNIKEVRIFSMLGVTVKEYLNPVNTIDVGDLNSGIYTVQVKAENGIIVNKKIVVQ